MSTPHRSRVRAAAPSATAVRVGIGGWTFEPWRGLFYPPGLPHAQELAFASRQVNAIEINGTFYRAASPKTYAHWRAQVPDGFVFAVKASMYTTHRRVLSEAGESVERFVRGGLGELGDALGPVLWQLPATKAFDPADPSDFDAFLALLPARVDGLPLRHAIEVRHPSFACPQWLALARRHGVATVFTESARYPGFADLTGPFVYVRLMRAQARLKAGFPPSTLDALAACARAWQRGGEPSGLPRVEPAPTRGTGPRDVFLFVIDGAKQRAPAAASALLQRLAC